MRVAYIQGEKVEFKFLPKTFKNLPCFDKRREEVWNEKGFYRIQYETPTATQKQGVEGSLVDNVYVIPAVDLTPEEIAAREEAQLNSDVSQQEINKRRLDGATYYDRIFAKIERKYRNEEITGQQAVAAVNFFDPLTEGLNRGQWIIVQSKLNNATVPTGYKPLFDEIKNKVDAYVQNNY